MRFQKEISKGILTVRLMGELDELSAAETRAYLDKQIESGGFGELILDFSQVEFMDSTGIGVLLGRYKRLQKSGISLAVTGINKQIDKVFRISGLYQIIKAVQS